MQYLNYFIPLSKYVFESFKKKYSGISRFNIFGEIFWLLKEGLEELHNLGIVHRDIKPENIMVHIFSIPKQVIYIDFGLSRTIEEFPQEFPEESSKTSEELSKTREEKDTIPIYCGSPIYMHPSLYTFELEKRNKKFDYSKKITWLFLCNTDLFSLGIVFLFCLFNMTPIDLFEQLYDSETATYPPQKQFMRIVEECKRRNIKIPPRHINEFYLEIYPYLFKKLQKIVAEESVAEESVVKKLSAEKSEKEEAYAKIMTKEEILEFINNNTII
jgi:serine/threonine protein kinase